MTNQERFQVLSKPRTQRFNHRVPNDLKDRLEKEAKEMGEKLGVSLSVTDLVLLKLYKKLDGEKK